MTAPERLLGERYEVGELLGYGGMAEVHRGRDLRLGRDVAIKMLRTDLARDNTFQMRFRREAQNAASLNHPAIAAVYDTGEEKAPTGEALPYIVMEFVNGRNLKEVLGAEQRLLPRRALEITADICAALEFSHRHGIIHRDVKPGNVMITGNGQVKVMDFGIARALASGATTMTQTSAVIGTAQYLSPEQARGEAVDARSDVYAAGCVLFELLCGHPPFVGDSPVAVAYQHVREDPRAPSEVNPEVGSDVDAVVLKALAKNPVNRYQSAAEMRADLLRAAAGRPVLATPVMRDAETAMLGARTQPISGGPGGPGARVGPADTRRTPTWVLASLGVLGALAVVALIVALNLTSQGEDTVAVPDLIGLTADQAEAAIEERGLEPEEGPVVESADCTVDQVAAQSPAADADAIEVGSTVTYQLCAGPASFEIPRLIGFTEQAAIEELKELGFVPKVEAENSSAPEGQVVRTDPAAGELATEGSEVTLFVSEENITTVPDVVGETETQATATLQAQGFKVDTVDADQAPSSQEQIGTVASQNPTAGTDAETDTTVTIEVYRAPDLTMREPDVQGANVSVSWDNSIFGPVTIDWGDGRVDDGAASGTAQHRYDGGETEQTFRITITSESDPDRTVSQQVTIGPIANPTPSG